MAKRDDSEGGQGRRRTAGGAVTMEAVGRLAGVSQVTVSRALSNPEKVSPDTLRRIQEAIEATGFVPNAIAGALASRKSRLISALVPSITNIVYSAMVQSFSERIRAGGYQIMLSETGFLPETEEAVIAAHLSRRPDGILLTGVQHSAAARRMLLGSRVPVVEIWDLTQNPIDICVGFSHVRSAIATAEFAVERGFAAAATITAGDERAKRRQRAFAAEFHRRTGREVPAVDLEGSATLGGGRAALRTLLDARGFGGGVVFCSSDILAHGALIEASVRGIRVPEQLAIIGFGDQEFASDLSLALTTVRIDRSELGQTAADAVVARIEGRSVPPVTDVGFSIIRRQTA